MAAPAAEVLQDFPNVDALGSEDAQGAGERLMAAALGGRWTRPEGYVALPQASAWGALRAHEGAGRPRNTSDSPRSNRISSAGSPQDRGNIAPLSERVKNFLTSRYGNLWPILAVLGVGGVGGIVAGSLLWGSSTLALASLAAIPAAFVAAYLGFQAGHSPGSPPLVGIVIGGLSMLAVGASLGSLLVSGLSIGGSSPGLAAAGLLSGLAGIGLSWRTYKEPDPDGAPPAGKAEQIRDFLGLVSFWLGAGLALFGLAGLLASAFSATLGGLPALGIVLGPVAAGGIAGDTGGQGQRQSGRWGAVLEKMKKFVSRKYFDATTLLYFLGAGGVVGLAIAAILGSSSWLLGISLASIPGGLGLFGLVTACLKREKGGHPGPLSLLAIGLAWLLVGAGIGSLPVHGLSMGAASPGLAAAGLATATAGMAVSWTIDQVVIPRSKSENRVRAWGAMSLLSFWLAAGLTGFGLAGLLAAALGG